MAPDDPPPGNPERKTTKRERDRYRFLHRLRKWLEPVMIVLGIAWLAIVIIDVTMGLGRSADFLLWSIWGVFVLDFLVELIIAPRRLRFIGRNWLTVLSLMLPPFRVLRILWLARSLRFLRLFRLIAAVNRNMNRLKRYMAHRQLGYVIVMTAIVVLAGAAGMYAFERHVDHPEGLHTYWDALWWTAMILTTLGSGYWPRSMEGRVLCFLLSVYTFGIFGYVTASLASFFVGQDRKRS